MGVRDDVWNLQVICVREVDLGVAIDTNLLDPRELTTPW